MGAARRSQLFARRATCAPRGSVCIDQIRAMRRRMEVAHRTPSTGFYMYLRVLPRGARSHRSCVFCFSRYREALNLAKQRSLHNFWP